MLMPQKRERQTLRNMNQCSILPSRLNRTHLQLVLFVYGINFMSSIYAQSTGDEQLWMIQSILQESDFSGLTAEYVEGESDGELIKTIEFSFNDWMTNIEGRFIISGDNVLLSAAASSLFDGAVESFKNYQNKKAMYGEKSSWSRATGENSAWIATFTGRTNQVVFMYIEQLDFSSSRKALKDKLLFAFDELYSEYMLLQAFDLLYSGTANQEEVLEILSWRLQCMEQFAIEVLGWKDYPVSFPFGDYCNCQVSMLNTDGNLRESLPNPDALGHDELLKDCLPLLPGRVPEIILGNWGSADEYNDALWNESVDMCTSILEKQYPEITRSELSESCKCKFASYREQERFVLEDFFSQGSMSMKLLEDCGYPWPKE